MRKTLGLVLAAVATVALTGCGGGGGGPAALTDEQAMERYEAQNGVDMRNDINAARGMAKSRCEDFDETADADLTKWLADLETFLVGYVHGGWDLDGVRLEFEWQCPSQLARFDKFRPEPFKAPDPLTDAEARDKLVWLIGTELSDSDFSDLAIGGEQFCSELVDLSATEVAVLVAGLKPAFAVETSRVFVEWKCPDFLVRFDKGRIN